jgi:hypothetical protein
LKIKKKQPRRAPELLFKIMLLSALIYPLLRAKTKNQQKKNAMQIFRSHQAYFLFLIILFYHLKFLKTLSSYTSLSTGF